ncbi:hypothetical protein EDD21DRAFT_413348 [Dissophora ornata]|nr:hypothetical protein EDD21DRAFT_413348 [Dissophora ornata]
MAASRRFRLAQALVFILTALSFSTHNVAHASIFGAPVSKLSYDRISVKDVPSSIGTADTIVGGNNIAAGTISQTGSIPKDGLSGVLFDMGYACTPGFDANNTLSPPDFYGLPRIALIRRGGPTTNDTCTFRTKILNALANSSIAAIVYNNPGTAAVDGATASADSSEAALGIPGMLISYDDGMMLRTLLQESVDSTSVDFYNRVRVTLTMDQKMSVIWEFVLIIVVVLLAISFTVSVVLHCRLYALRQRIRMDALARGADVLPNGTIRMRRLTLDKAALDELPVRVYGQDRVPSLSGSGSEPATAATATAVAGTAAIISTTPEASSSSIKKEDHIEADASNNNPSRSNSFKGSISGKSIRSLKALAAATALDAVTNAQETSTPAPSITPAPTPVLDEVTGDTCAVCLEEFEDGEELRILPCRHEFHCECIDPWLVRKSSTCPLCKYDCLPQVTEEIEGQVEDANIVVPNDRFVEFIMGPDWIASRAMRGHNGTNTIDRIGYFLGTISDRLRGRPPRPPPGPTVHAMSRPATPLYRVDVASSSRAIQLDEHGQSSQRARSVDEPTVVSVPSVSVEEAKHEDMELEPSSSSGPSAVVDIPTSHEPEVPQH